MHRFTKAVRRYLWDPEPMNEHPDVPIVCLGKTYRHCAAQTEAAPTAQTTDARAGEAARSQPWPADFLDDHEARYWLTYRTGFDKIAKTAAEKSLATRLGIDGFTSDTGFGCMIRSTQTLLANAISIAHAGRDWRRSDTAATNRESAKASVQDVEAQIMRLFADDERAAFGVHKFVEHGAAACDVQAGQWFGPSAAALCIDELSRRPGAAETRMSVYRSTEQGGVIYEDALREAWKDGDSMLILVPHRLGINGVHPRYRDALLDLFAWPQCVGIAGGRPSSAHYFFARQADQLFFLDPHLPRPAMPYHDDLSKYDGKDRDLLHTRRVRMMGVEDMDPSMLLGVLCTNDASWVDFKARCGAVPAKERLLSVVARRPEMPLRRAFSSFSKHESSSSVAQVAEELVEAEDDDVDIMSDPEGLQ